MAVQVSSVIFECDIVLVSASAQAHSGVPQTNLLLSVLSVVLHPAGDSAAGSVPAVAPKKVSIVFTALQQLFFAKGFQP